ncbi:adenylyl cyclase beta, putative, partial [Plasmodium reichenowi]
IKKIYKKYIES